MPDRINGKRFLKNICNINKLPEYTFKGTSAEEFSLWQADTVKKLEKILCFDKIADCELICEKTEEIDDLKTAGGFEYKRMLWNISTAEGLIMPVYMLVPKNNGNGIPAIAVHCHGSDGKNGMVGMISEELYKNSARFTFTYAFDMLEKGYTVFCPDILGSGSRKSISINRLKESDCSVLNFTLMALGMNLQGVIIWELKKLIDFIQTMDLDMEKLVCVGFSGGGLETLWLAAMDDRVKTAYISGYFHSLKMTLLQSNFCGCNFINDLWSIIDLDILAELAAPKKLYIETGREDKLNGDDDLKNVYQLVENVKNIYEKYFNAEDFKFAVCSGGHRWYGYFLNEF